MKNSPTSNSSANWKRFRFSLPILACLAVTAIIAWVFVHFVDLNTKIGGVGIETEEKEETAKAAKPKGRTKAAPRKKTAAKAEAAKAEAAQAEPAAEAKTEAPPKKATRRTAKKETK